MSPRNNALRNDFCAEERFQVGANFGIALGACADTIAKTGGTNHQRADRRIHRLAGSTPNQNRRIVSAIVIAKRFIMDHACCMGC